MLTTKDTSICPLHPPTALLDMAIRARRPTLPHCPDISGLGLAPPYRPRIPLKFRIPLVALRPLNAPRRPPLLPRHPRRNNLAQRRHRAHAHRRICIVQHVRAGEQHHQPKYLPR